MKLLEEKDTQIITLEKENKMLQKRVTELEQTVEALTQAVLQSNKKLFGASSEKTPSSVQIALWGDETAGATTDAVTAGDVIIIKEHKRPVRKAGDRDKLIANLPKEIIECVINPEDAFCGVCKSSLVLIGKKKARSEMEYIPAKLIIKEYIENIYKCIDCGTTDEYPDAVIVRAKAPAPVLQHSIASPSIVAWIIYQKYRLSVPLYRQEKDFLRMGAELKRDMMSYWVIRCAEKWLKPIYDKMHQQLLKSNIVMSDETTWQVNKEKGKLPSSKSYIWIHRTGDFETIQVVLYEYTRTRVGDHAREFLRGFSGYHVSDAYAGYEKVEDIIRCLCYSHLRRYYLEAIPLDSRKKEIPGSGGAIGRDYCDKLFRLERKWKTLSPEERKEKRLLYSEPILLEFITWAEGVVTPQENLRKALNYTKNHKEYFLNFLLDGRIPISNNLSEIAVKPVAITRKNVLFSDSVDGAITSALIFSIINTATANNLDPFKYLEFLFSRLPNCDWSSNEDGLDEFLPWSDKMQAAFRTYDAKEVFEEKEELLNESA